MLTGLFKHIGNTRTLSIGLRRLYATGTIRRCWHCQAECGPGPVLFCNSCNVIQSPKSMQNYFTVFNLPVGYNVNTTELSKQYRHYQSLLHPDKFSNKSDTERTLSDEYSSLVNVAYKTLVDPLSRAEHILGLSNMRVDEGTTDQTSPELLMKIMELNEQLDTAEADGGRQGVTTMRQIRDFNRKDLATLETQIQAMFEKNDLQGAKKLLVRLKYYLQIKNRINAHLYKKGIE